MISSIDIISNYIGATIVEVWENFSLAAKIFEQSDEDVSFPFLCNLLTKDDTIKLIARHAQSPLKMYQDSVDVPNCLLDVKDEIWCSDDLIKLDPCYVSKYLKEMKIYGIADTVEILVEKELKHVIELLDMACIEYWDDNIIKISQNEVDFNPYYLDDAMEAVMQSMDDDGGLGNILVNTDTFEKLKHKKLLNNDFLNFTLEAANGRIMIHDCIPCHTVYALSYPHNLGPMPFKGVSLSRRYTGGKVIFDIIEHVGFMVANPRGIKKITWR